jgi:hypothetical protein
MVIEASYRKMGGKRSPETLCVSNLLRIVSSITQYLYNVLHAVTDFGES